MTAWFERGRPALFEALTAVCDQIGRDLRTESEEREQNSFNVDNGEFDVAERPAVEAGPALLQNLEAENVQLRAQLAQLKTDRHPTPSQPQPQPQPHGGKDQAPGTPTSTSSPLPQLSALNSNPSSGEVSDWKNECIKTRLKFNALSNNFKTAKEALQKRKNERESWMQFARVLERKIKAAEDEHGIRILDRKSRSTPPSIDDKTVVPRRSAFATGSRAEDAEAELPELRAAPSTANKDVVTADVQPESTQGDADETVPEDLPKMPLHDNSKELCIKQEPSSDAPCVVSERAVRKRKLGDDATGSGTSRRVKVEATRSSSPNPPMEPRGCSPPESLDLGNIVQRMLTPRKRKELENSRATDEAYINASTMRTPVPMLAKSAQLPQTTRPVHRSSALTPMSVNRRVVKSGGYRPKQRSVSTGLVAGISSLAEDGAAYESDAISAIKSRTSHANSPTAKGRLDTLLNSPAPVPDTTISRPVHHGRGSSASTGEEILIPGRRHLPFDNAGRQTGARQGKDPTLTPRAKVPGKKIPASDKPPRQNQRTSAPRLRDKPASELRPDDFKVNPLANEGHDFAYSDVVRNKNDRSCLPGCTDLHCCGEKFRALALSQRPNPPLTAAQRQEEQKLLEDYLGDYSFRLATLTSAERMDLWVEAKTQELSNKYGTHRNRFSRMRSPPGFWNADFPSTQELEDERAEAKRRERQMAGERHREAMRPGGRWIFRDE